MIHSPGSPNQMPADEARANWEWLQDRVQLLRGRDSLGNWLGDRLAELEVVFADCVTAKSLTADTRKELLSDRGSL